VVVWLGEEGVESAVISYEWGLVEKQQEQEQHQPEGKNNHCPKRNDGGG